MHLKPCFWLRILPSIGIVSSVRYSSSPEIRTMCLASSPPLGGLNTSVSSAPEVETKASTEKSTGKTNFILVTEGVSLRNKRRVYRGQEASPHSGRPFLAGVEPDTSDFACRA